MGTLRKYTAEQYDETSGIGGNRTGLAACFVKFRKKDGVKDGDSNGYGTSYWWELAQIDGDPAAIENTLQTFINETGMNKRSIGNQKTGNGPVRLPLNLKMLTPESRKIASLSEYDPVISFTPHAGTRKIVSTWTGAFVASQAITMTFTTTNVTTGVTSSATTVNVTFTSDDTTTKAAVLAAITANTGIATTSAWSSDVLTIYAKSGYYITVTAAMASTGGSSPPTVTNVETDTSIKTAEIDESNGAISRMSFGVATGEAQNIQDAIDNAPRGAKVELQIPTGDSDLSEYEYRLVARVDVDNDRVYLQEATSQLAIDGQDVKVVAMKEIIPGGDNLPKYEIQLDFRDHSNKTQHIVYIPCASPGNGTTPPKYTAEGYKATINFVCEERLFTVNGTEILLPYKDLQVNSAVAAY